MKARKNAYQRKYRADNLDQVEYGKRISRGRVRAREILKQEGKELDNCDREIERMAKAYVNELWEKQKNKEREQDEGNEEIECEQELEESDDNE